MSFYVIFSFPGNRGPGSKNNNYNNNKPVAVESLGPINASGRVFLSKLGRKLADQSGNDRKIIFLF